MLMYLNAHRKVQRSTLGVRRQGIKQRRENSSENSLIMVNLHTDMRNIHWGFLKQLEQMETCPVVTAEVEGVCSLGVFSRSERTTMPVNCCSGPSLMERL